jgi:hypothetical protein
MHTLHAAALNLFCIWDRHLYSGFSSHLILWQKLQHAVFVCGSCHFLNMETLFFHKLYRHCTGFSEYVLRRYDSKQMALGEPKHALWNPSIFDGINQKKYRLRTYSEKPVQCLYNLWKKSGFLPCLMSKLYLHFYEICCCHTLPIILL